MLTAQNRQATRAKTTARGSEPPANATPAGMEAAMAAPGAMSVMLWKATSRSPMASRRRPCACVVSGKAMATSADLGACGDGLMPHNAKTDPREGWRRGCTGIPGGRPRAGRASSGQVHAGLLHARFALAVAAERAGQRRRPLTGQGYLGGHIGRQPDAVPVDQPDV